MTEKEIGIVSTIRDALWELEGGHDRKAEEILNMLVEEIENL
jgi:hypothetical protein